MTRAPPLPHGGQRANRRVNPGMQLRLSARDHQGRSVRITGEEHVATHRPGRDLRPAPTGVRSLGAPGRELKPNQPLRQHASAAPTATPSPHRELSTSAARAQTREQSPEPTRRHRPERCRLLATCRDAPRDRPRPDPSRPTPARTILQPVPPRPPVRLGRPATLKQYAPPRPRAQINDQQSVQCSSAHLRRSSQTSGQGYERRPVGGSGNRPSATTRSARRRNTSTSIVAQQSLTVSPPPRLPLSSRGISCSHIRDQTTAAICLARVVPDHGAQLLFLVERQPVVDPPQLVAHPLENVSTLAIGVVRNPVEHGELAHVVGVLLAQLEEGPAVVGRDVGLQRSDAVFHPLRPLDRRRDELPAQCCRQLIGRHFPPVQIGRESPTADSRPCPAYRLRSREAGARRRAAVPAERRSSRRTESRAPSVTVEVSSHDRHPLVQRIPGLLRKALHHRILGLPIPSP